VRASRDSRRSRCCSDANSVDRNGSFGIVGLMGLVKIVSGGRRAADGRIGQPWMRRWSRGFRVGEGLRRIEWLKTCKSPITTL
jgi:hypothetical protein